MIICLSLSDLLLLVLLFLDPSMLLQMTFQRIGSFNVYEVESTNLFFIVSDFCNLRYLCLPQSCKGMPLAIFTYLLFHLHVRINLFSLK